MRNSQNAEEWTQLLNKAAAMSGIPPRAKRVILMRWRGKRFKEISKTEYLSLRQCQRDAKKAQEALVRWMVSAPTRARADGATKEYV